MRPDTTRLFLRLLAATTVLLLISVGFAADSVNWTLVPQPSSGGAIRWQTSSPARNGTANSRKTVTFDSNTFLDVWAEPAPGYQLVSFRKGSDEIIFFLDGALHFQFGPVDNSHSLTAVFAPVLPTGTFDLTAPLDNPAVTNMVDLTGSYAGVSPIEARLYDFDIATDEAGKAVVVGTVEGVAPAGGGSDLTAAGKVSTVNDAPQYGGKLKFVGMRDGADAKGSMSASGPAELQGPGGDIAQGNVSYSGKVGGVPMRDQNVPAQTTVDPATQANVQREWGIVIDVVERVGKAAKPHVAASAVLTLPNGDVIEFAEKKAKYTAKNGLKLNLKKGTNTTIVPNAVDKKTKISVKNMTLDKVGDDWVVTGGTMKYAFLGQKGTADVLDFLGP